MFAVSDMHEREVLHNNLERETIVYHAQLHPTFAHFGYAKPLTLAPNNQEYVGVGKAGAPAFAAPETNIIRGDDIDEQGYVTTKSDVYAAAAVAFYGLFAPNLEFSQETRVDWLELETCNPNLILRTSSFSIYTDNVSSRTLTCDPRLATQSSKRIAVQSLSPWHTIIRTIAEVGTTSARWTTGGSMIGLPNANVTRPPSRLGTQCGKTPGSLIARMRYFSPFPTRPAYKGNRR